MRALQVSSALRELIEVKEMKMQKIKEMTGAELDNMLGDLRKEKLNLHIQSRTGQLENPAKFNQIRKDIARIQTEQTARKASGTVK